MKSISASIVILTGAILVLEAVEHSGGDMGVVLLLGFGICLAGFYGWFLSFKEK
jgi:hypothetical protein